MKLNLFSYIMEKTNARTDNIGENFFNIASAYDNFYNNPDLIYIVGEVSLPEVFLNNITKPLPEVTEYINNLKIEIDKRKQNSKGKYGVSIGMSKEAVLNSSWGKPQDINTTITQFGTHEQWVYGGGNYLYFENGKLTSIQN
ncbi:hypothetical protein [Neobacillus dielmonensis]|uniref:hypothetical protein n=1 Tax=Neobacillus dielmonensis TaxID=1347369 RepID=UPI0006933837|nr:hypothetical protein [Neobacillus dielmonensis]